MHAVDAPLWATAIGAVSMCIGLLLVGYKMISAMVSGAVKKGNQGPLFSKGCPVFCAPPLVALYNVDRGLTRVGDVRLKGSIFLRDLSVDLSLDLSVAGVTPADVHMHVWGYPCSGRPAGPHVTFPGILR
jgi:hypothetical protein